MHRPPACAYPWRSGQMVERDQATETRMIVAEPDFRIVQSGDRGNQRQAKAVAGLRSAAREPIEAAKNLVILAEGYSGTVVFDGGGHGVARHCQTDQDPSARGSVTDCVLDQTAEQLRQRFAVAARPYVLL